MKKPVTTVLMLVIFSFGVSCTHTQNKSVRSNPEQAIEFDGHADEKPRGRQEGQGKKEHDRKKATIEKTVRPGVRNAKSFVSPGKGQSEKNMSWPERRDYDRAIAEYTEEIRLNPENVYAFHNRGRIRFFKGEFPAAADDLAMVLRLNPESRYAAIWLYLARSRSDPDGARKELLTHAERLRATDWPTPVVALYAGQALPETVMEKAADSHIQTHNEQLCEAHFYLGEWHLLHGEKERARAMLRTATDRCPKTYVEHAGATAELRRLK